MEEQEMELNELVDHEKHYLNTLSEVEKEFKGNIENIIGEQISFNEFCEHRFSVGKGLRSQYLELLLDYQNLICVGCQKTALDLYRGEFQSEYPAFTMINSENIICFGCWITFNEPRWLEYASVEYENLKSERYEKSLSPLDKHIRGERKKIKPKFRREVLVKDSYKCVYCGKDFSASTQPPVIEHMVPLTQYGETSIENCVTACSRCNNKKANLTPVEAGMELKFGRFAEVKDEKEHNASD